MVFMLTLDYRDFIQFDRDQTAESDEPA